MKGFRQLIVLILVFLPLLTFAMSDKEKMRQYQSKAGCMACHITNVDEESQDASAHQ